LGFLSPARAFVMMLSITSGKLGYRLYTKNGVEQTEETFTRRSHGPRRNATARDMAVPVLERRLANHEIKFYTLKVTV
jgi:hypothetical protein